MENITQARLVKTELSFSRLIQKLRGCWWHQWEKMLVKGTLNYQFKYNYKDYWNVFFFWGGGNSSYELRNLLTGWKGSTTDILEICLRFWIKIRLPLCHVTHTELDCSQAEKSCCAEVVVSSIVTFSEFFDYIVFIIAHELQVFSQCKRQEETFFCQYFSPLKKIWLSHTRSHI